MLFNVFTKISLEYCEIIFNGYIKTGIFVFLREERDWTREKVAYGI